MKELPEALRTALHQIDMNHRRPVAEVRHSAKKVEALAKVFPDWEYEIVRTADNMLTLAENWQLLVEEGLIA